MPKSLETRLIRRVKPNSNTATITAYPGLAFLGKRKDVKRQSTVKTGHLGARRLIRVILEEKLNA
jgi:hypothetical protein